MDYYDPDVNGNDKVILDYNSRGIFKTITRANIGEDNVRIFGWLRNLAGHVLHKEPSNDCGKLAHRLEGIAFCGNNIP